MILQNTPESNDLPFIDVGRPSFTNEESFQYWAKFFSLVESSSVPLYVNSLYSTMKRYVDTRSPYMGGGFKFQLWFNNNADRKQFVSEMKQAGFEFDDFRNLYFITKPEELLPELSPQEIANAYAVPRKTVTNLRFNEKYLQFAQTVATQYNIVIEQASSAWYEAKGSIRDLHNLKQYLNECYFDL